MVWGIYSAIYGEVNVSVEKCVEIKGDYVEKQHSCFISVTLKSWSGRKLLDPTTYLRLSYIYSTVGHMARITENKLSLWSNWEIHTLCSALEAWIVQ